MKNKLFIFSALIVSAFLFSACTIKDQIDQKILNKIGQKEAVIPTITETGDETEAELLKQIDAETDPSFDIQFKNLDTELNNN